MYVSSREYFLVTKYARVVSKTVGSVDLVLTTTHAIMERNTNINLKANIVLFVDSYRLKTLNANVYKTVTIVEVITTLV